MEIAENQNVVEDIWNTFDQEEITEEDIMNKPHLFARVAHTEIVGYASSSRKLVRIGFADF